MRTQNKSGDMCESAHVDARPSFESKVCLSHAQREHQSSARHIHAEETHVKMHGTESAFVCTYTHNNANTAHGSAHSDILNRRCRGWKFVCWNAVECEIRTDSSDARIYLISKAFYDWTPIVAGWSGGRWRRRTWGWKTFYSPQMWDEEHNKIYLCLVWYCQFRRGLLLTVFVQYNFAKNGPILSAILK